MPSIYDQHLARNAANFVALSPVSFVARSAEIYADLPAVVHGARRYTWAQTRDRAARLGAALRALGVGRGSTVSVMLPDTPEMVEAHHAVPALGAVLNTLNTRLDAALLAWQMNHSGWCFPWTVAMLGGTLVCLRRAEAKAILDAMREHRADHFCAAPIVRSLIYNAPDDLRAGISQQVRGMVSGATPPAAMIEGMAKIGVDITHVYGLTEVCGPAAVAVKRPAWADAALSEQTRLNGRQGVRYTLQEGMTVRHPESLAEAPADGQTMGEIMFRGNIVMKGYLKNATATDHASRDPLRGDFQDLDRQDPEVPIARPGPVEQHDRLTAIQPRDTPPC